GFEHGGVPYLLCADGKADDPLDKALAVTDLLDGLDRIAARDQILILDACHSGLTECLPMKTTTWSSATHNLLEGRSVNRYVVSGASVGGLSYESEQLGAGV